MPNMTAETRGICDWLDRNGFAFQVIKEIANQELSWGDVMKSITREDLRYLKLNLHWQLKLWDCIQKARMDKETQDNSVRRIHEPN